MEVFCGLIVALVVSHNFECCVPDLFVVVITIMDPGNKEVTVQDNFEQAHNELVFEETWWWAVHICLCAIAVVANTIFIVTVLYNR